MTVSGPEVMPKNFGILKFSIHNFVITVTMLFFVLQLMISVLEAGGHGQIFQDTSSSSVLDCP